MRVGTGNTSYESDADGFLSTLLLGVSCVNLVCTLLHNSKKSGFGGDLSECPDRSIISKLAVPVLPMARATVTHELVAATRTL